MVELRVVRKPHAEDAVEALRGEGCRYRVHRGEVLVRHVDTRGRDGVGEDGPGNGRVVSVADGEVARLGRAGRGLRRVVRVLGGA